MKKKTRHRGGALLFSAALVAGACVGDSPETLAEHLTKPTVPEELKKDKYSQPNDKAVDYASRTKQDLKQVNLLAMTFACNFIELEVVERVGEPPLAIVENTEKSGLENHDMNDFSAGLLEVEGNFREATDASSYKEWHSDFSDTYEFTKINTDFYCDYPSLPSSSSK